ncbi:MAG TPA: VCBS repeat-containing protein, partial [Polyangiaceae bacterium]
DLVVPVHTIGQVAINLNVSPMSALWTISAGSPAPTYSGTIAAAPVDSQGPALLRFNGNVGSGPYARYSLAGSVLAYLDQGLVPVDGTDRNVVAFVQRTKGGAVFDMVSTGMSGVGLSRVRRIAGDTIATVWTEYLSNGAVSKTQPTQAFALHDPIGVDVDGDGTDEVVLGSDDGRLYALHASDGSLAFSLDLGAPVAHVIAADIDLDPAVELVASLADGRLVAIDGPGKYTAVQDVPPADAGADAAPGDAGVGPDGGAGDDGGCGPGGAGVSEHSGCSCRAAGAAERGDAGGLLALAAVLGLGAAHRRRAQGRCVQRGGGGEQDRTSSIATR